jgi:hypothetical protein
MMNHGMFLSFFPSFFSSFFISLCNYARLEFSCFPQCLFQALIQMNGA